MNVTEKQLKLDELRRQVDELESELATERQTLTWPPQGFYGTFYATTGAVLGAFAAITSLMVNVAFAPLVGKSPLELIKVYLTFPMGDRALNLPPDSSILVLALGCTLYIATGMLLGVPLYWALVRICGKNASLPKRLAVASVLSLAIFAINFYVLLSWLQPVLFGGKWITDPSILPPWVASGTHLIFGWTLAALYPLGQFTPYRSPIAESDA